MRGRRGSAGTYGACSGAWAWTLQHGHVAPAVQRRLGDSGLERGLEREPKTWLGEVVCHDRVATCWW
jgi:hypothetical protein